MRNSLGIENKVVVITGASSGIGEATVLLLAERGAKVVLRARGSDRLQARAARIADGGGEAAYARTDVRRRDDLSNLVKIGMRAVRQARRSRQQCRHYASFSPR